MQKTTRKHTQYLRNEIILIIVKNGLHAKAIAFSKLSLYVKK